MTPDGPHRGPAPRADAVPAPAGMDVLRRVEEDLAVFEPTVAGFAAWPVLRFEAWQLISGVRTVTRTGRARAMARRAGRLYGLAVYGGWSALRRRRLRGKRFDLLVMTHESHRLRQPGGWWDLYLDDIVAHAAFHGRALRIEHREFTIPRLRTVAPRHLFTDLQLLDRMRRRGAGTRREAAAVADAVCDRFFERARRAGAGPVHAGDEQRFRARARAMVSRFHGELHWFEDLLGEFRPSVVLLTDAYNQHGLVAAARRLRIPAVEFQHGNVHPDHPGYIWFPPARAIRERLPIPDCIATYGAYWSDVLTAGGSWMPGQVPPVGSVRIDRARRARSRAAGGALEIVFTSQYATRDRTIPLLVEFIGLAEAGGLDYRLAVKVHRGERGLMHEYAALGRLSPRVSVVDPYERDTLAMIADADVHVSGWSTCHYEAVALGTPTVVLVFPGPDRVGGLAEFSSVHRATSARELLEEVLRAREARAAGAAARERESDRLFRHGAVENAVELLRHWVPG